MTALETIIKDIIKSRGTDGHMDLAEYMGLCLGHPEHGYYMTRDPFGTQGDFTTAPEISQMFGELIGAWMADTWAQLGMPTRLAIIECGAGRGTLMADALRATKAVAGFHDAINLRFIEMSPVLSALQQKALEGYDASWHTDIESVQVDSPVLIIGNEFLDALPVRQMVLRDTGWFEKVVKININDTLCLGEIRAEESTKSLLPQLLFPPKTGAQVEVSLELQCVLIKFMNSIKKQRGSALFIDYGFMHSVGGDTLQAVKNHGFCDVLDSPGEVDITAHVNFAEISRMAMENNMTVHGPVSQGDFLNRLGMGVRVEKLTQNATPAQRVDIAAAVKRLTGKNTKDGEMGELFKAIAITSDPAIDLAGF